MQKPTQNEYCRFPKLEECAHFHYERVQLGKIMVKLVEDKFDPHNSNLTQTDANTTGSSTTSQQLWFIIRVTAEKAEPFLIRRSFENMKMLDEMLHRCVYDRKISNLVDLSDLELDADDIQMDNVVAEYLDRFSAIVSDSLTCGQILSWFQLDNKGQRLPLADSDTMKCINTPAVGAAYGIRKYNAQACDEISIEVGDMISVIDMPSPAESVWWRGKKSHLQKSQYEVGFFPQSCVATIGDKVPRHLVLPAPLVGSLDVSPTKPVLRKHGKLIAFFRSFILSRPSRRCLKQSGIYKERVFSCDLSEHLLNSGQEIPMVLKVCSQYIEEFGIVDGIYRLSGITSNIQKLRSGFDEERVPDLVNPEMRQDIHATSSLVKMYFRELPNPLCTYQLYDHFVEAIQNRGEPEERLQAMKETVQKLPPPHYRTLKYLMTHLNKIAQHSARTGMTDRNLAIVWAPNLLRSPSLEAGGVAALRGVGVQAVVTEYLITNCHKIFDENFESTLDTSMSETIEDAEEAQADSLPDLTVPICIERPKSLGVSGGARLISLEEAQNRHNRIEFIDLNKTNPMNTPGGSSSYIEVGGGPSSLPDKYHTVLPVPRSWQKRKTHSWKSLFTRGQRNPNANELKINPSTPSIAKEAHRNSVPSPVKSETDKLKQITRSSQKKVTKSIDFSEGKPMEICARSTSADSLRTSGHSRSVSHDSYFDLLQSPLRAVAISPSREFSELGLNFDREEPEMRIFSESESLVSSPRVPREMQSRRVTRCRTDDSSAVNSVNPSPKKQPRLNLPSTKENQWNANNRNQTDDGSLRKRSKVEERRDYNIEDRQSLSDIQYIDSITPEHTITTNTIYACAQIHNPPSSNRTSILEETPTDERLQLRTNTLDSKINDKTENKESRFSYPGMGEKFSDDKRFLSRFSMNDNNEKNRRSFSELKNTSRSSVGLVLSSSSPDHLKNNENDHSKVSIPTPSSPSKSPKYSLLGETSSENSSTLNTPAFDMDMSSATQHFDQRMNELKGMSGNESKDSSLPMSTENGEQSSNQNRIATNANPIDIRRDLSLDLEKSKMSIDDASPPSNKQNVNMSSTSNTPNFTQTSGSTSQSMTPSEFGYQHLNRQSNVVSIDSSPKSDVYETLEQAFANYEPVATPVQSLPPIKAKSPIKATINITYKSPVRNTPSLNYVYPSGDQRPISPDPNQFPDYETVDIQNDSYESVDVIPMVTKPLETSFDDNGVYEQLKFFKGAVSEVNHLLNNGNDVQQQQKQQKHVTNNKFNDNLNTPQVVPTIESATVAATGAVNEQMQSSETIADDKSDSGDVLMPEQELTQDSLEFDANLSMYENVNLRKSPNAYENVRLRLDGKTKSLNIQDTHTSLSLLGKENSKPVNFTVKQLANKFETSPIDAQPPFDFSKPFARKNCDTIRNSANPPKAKNPQQQQLNRTNNFTRSLDENAFVREFGSSRSNEKVNRSTHQIPIVTNILTENSPIRRSMNNDATKPKILNPPKRLPGLSDIENKVCKKENVDETMSNCDLKITPTNENPISLIQHNVNLDQKLGNDDDRNATNISNKVLSSFKLDRERIERIKEERRHQLNEKFRSESFKCEKENNKAKSKSKIELNELKDADKKISDSLQYKSKSRNEIYNKKDADTSLVVMQSLSGANDGSLGRVRSISDEKNQNNCPDTTKVDEKSVAFRSRKFDRRSIDLKREQEFNTALNGTVRTSVHLQREPVSPQISIRDVAALFESRSQNH